MRFIRRFEESLLDLFDKGLLNGTTHACIGQEADAVAVVEHLREGDHIFSNHRCHGHFLAQTGDALGLMAEIMGKPEGVCGGIGGSQHLCAPGLQVQRHAGRHRAGRGGHRARARSSTARDGLSVVFIGDGTLGEGAVYETLNIAALWQLPLLVVARGQRVVAEHARASQPRRQHRGALRGVRAARCGDRHDGRRRDRRGGAKAIEAARGGADPARS